MNPSIIVSIVSVSFSVLFGFSAIIFSFRNSRRDDDKSLKESVARDTRVDFKLDEITRNTADIKNDISSLKKDLRQQSDEIVLIKSSVDKAHARIDALMEVLDMKNGVKNE